MGGTRGPGSTVGIDEFLDQEPQFDAVIDARSPSEFALDHIPAAVNHPVLDDAERALVGTIYTQESPFKARRVGAALVARNIAAHLEEPWKDMPRTWRPLVYCWRGGMRSGAMVTVLAQVGWPVRRLEGGYRAYRRRVITDLQFLPARHRFVVLHGPTGSGKTALLEALAEAGAQVLDLESLAEHRGSVLGGFDGGTAGGIAAGAAQPGQRAFESRLWQHLRRFDPARPIFVESESRRIGRLSLPAPLFDALVDSECVRIAVPLEARVAHLLERYGDIRSDPAVLKRRLQFFVMQHGHKLVDKWCGWVDSARWDELARAIVQSHYDPAYQRGGNALYRRSAQARPLNLPALDRDTIIRAAHSLTSDWRDPGTRDAQ
jgi:tRNA 2-selenouridine synthase